jgi:hypothetical protein
MDHPQVKMLTRVWQQLEYRIDVCIVTHGVYIVTLGTHIEHLLVVKKHFFSFLVAVNNSVKVGPLVFLL